MDNPALTNHQRCQVEDYIRALDTDAEAKQRAYADLVLPAYEPLTWSEAAERAASGGFPRIEQILVRFNLLVYPGGKWRRWLAMFPDGEPIVEGRPFR